MSKGTVPNLDRFRVSITEADIKKAHRNNSFECVVAQAVKRTVPSAQKVQVDSQTIRFTTADERLQYLTPPIVSDYIIDFDAGDPPVAGWRFTLSDPKRIQRQLRSAASKAAQRANWRKRKGIPPIADPDLPAGFTADGNVPEAGHTVRTPGAKRPARTVFGAVGGKRVYGGRLLRFNRDRLAGVVDRDGGPVVSE